MSNDTDRIKTPRPKKARNDFFRVLLVGLFFVGAALLLKSPYIREQLFDINKLRNEVQSNGWRGILIFGLAAGFINALGIPRIWIAAMAGTLFGAIGGGFIALGATLLGSVINFITGRSLLRGPIKRRLPKRLKKWYKALERHGFKTILYLRLFPLTNATLTNLLGGASHMKFRDYIAATAIGYIPFTIAFSTLGSSAAKQSTTQLAGGLALFALVAIIQWLWSRMKKKTGSVVVDNSISRSETGY